MKKEPKVFENYPLWIVFITVLQNLIIYAAGAYLLFKIWLIWGIIYILYILFLEIYTRKEGCVSCCYYNKRCAFGRGKIAGLLFKKEDPQKFCKKQGKTLSTKLLFLLGRLKGRFKHEVF